ncbi:MAG: carbohydrate binding family 9 domain-containing protein, partial [Anaerolineales bacterium]|nr:carbohydrate binding family 9 domain-containing protein [Anaerolineales bacterium]
MGFFLHIDKGFFMRFAGQLLAFCGFVILVQGLMQTPLSAQDIDWEALQRSKVMTATRIEGEIKMDGILDEKEWEEATSFGDFVQKIPDTGEPATEQTEIRILYNQSTLYIGAHLWDSEGAEGIVVTDITKDYMTRNIDGLQVMLDTYDDDRNAFIFGSNPAEGRWDMQIGNNSSNSNWDGIWYNRTTIDEKGWHLEMAIPFKTLRFTSEKIQKWGINFERRVRRKNEESYWAPMPPP